jgi:hypothetical protein
MSFIKSWNVLSRMDNNHVTPPGSLVEILSHPAFDNKTVELTLFNYHRYAFFFWNKWSQLLKAKHGDILPPSLVTLDWHQDLAFPDDGEKRNLDGLDLSDNLDVALHCWLNLNPLNDTHIASAAYCNLIGDIYVHCRQRNDQQWGDMLFTDQFGNTHVIRRYKTFDELEAALLKARHDHVYFDIDLDFFAIENSYSGRDRRFKYMKKDAIHDMLKPERKAIRWIFDRLAGFTIALEPQHCGGLLASNKLLDILNKLYFKPGLFSSGDKDAGWKHLTNHP